MTDDDVRANIAAQKLRADSTAREADELAERVTDLEARAAATRDRLAAAGVAVPQGRSQPGAMQSRPDIQLPSWEELTAENRRWLDETGHSGISLDDLLTTEELDQLEALDPKGRERWSPGDYVTVGGCAVIGLLATAFDDQIDAAVKNGLGGLGKTGLFQHFEKQGKNLPIDYTGEGFGGPGHRVRSPGHDIGRPWEALRQIREGTFTGTYWDHGQQFKKVVPGYAPHDLPEALVLWLMHLAADIVTTTSLPLPWWSKLYECESRDLRKLAHDLYNPHGDVGLNIRSMLISKALPVISTELIVGVKVHLDARSKTGKFGKLTANQALRRNEMLLAAHAVTGLASVGKVVILAPEMGPLALRHLNVPAVARAGFLGWKVALEHRRRTADRRVPGWDEILAAAPVPWQLDEVAAIKTQVDLAH